MMWLIAAGVIFGLWYIGTHDNNTTTPGTTPPGQTQPGGGGDQAVIAAQKFTASFNEVDGQVQATQGQWVNGSNVTVASITLTCEQMDNNGQNLAQSTNTMTGPAPPGSTNSVSTFSLGAAAQGVARAKCTVTGATTQ